MCTLNRTNKDKAFGTGRFHGCCLRSAAHIGNSIISPSNSSPKGDDSQASLLPQQVQWDSVQKAEVCLHPPRGCWCEGDVPWWASAVTSLWMNFLLKSSYSAVILIKTCLCKKLRARERCLSFKMKSSLLRCTNLWYCSVTHVSFTSEVVHVRDVWVLNPSVVTLQGTLSCLHIPRWAGEGVYPYRMETRSGLWFCMCRIFNIEYSSPLLVL